MGNHGLWSRRSRVWRRGMGRSLWSLILGLGLALWGSSLLLPSHAQTVNRGTIAEILDGSEVFIQNAQARTGDSASQGQRIRTGAARAQVNFNTGAVARLSSNSSLTVGQCAQLQRGVLLVNGAVNGCTSSVTAGVRGTTYILEVDEDGREQVKVLEGEVVVTRENHPMPEAEDDALPPSAAAPADPLPTPPEASSLPPAGEIADPSADDAAQESVVLTAGERIATRRGDRLGSPERLSAEEFIEILRGVLFEGFLGDLPGFERIQESFQRLYPNIPFPLNGVGLPENRVPTPVRPRLPF